jgi:pimeloyl-ACP methyl ester carboxylesterase
MRDLATAPPVNPLPNILRFRGRSSPRIVSFGGCDGNFDWDRRLAAEGVSALCLKDSRRRWYLDGCDGFDEDQTLQLISDHLCGRPALFIGQSAGGYAALRYADRFRASVLAFAPQTFYHAEGQTRTPADLADIREQIVSQPRSTTFNIYVAKCEDENPPTSYFWNDHLHITELEKARNVRMHVVDSKKHPCAYHLAQAGLLDGIVTSAILGARKR